MNGKEAKEPIDCFFSDIRIPLPKHWFASEKDCKLFQHLIHVDDTKMNQELYD